MEGVKAHSQITEISGKADPFKVCVESPFDDGIISQGVYDFLRQAFSLRKVDDSHVGAIGTVAEQQDFKVRRFGIFINAALGQMYRRYMRFSSKKRKAA